MMSCPILLLFLILRNVGTIIVPLPYLLAKAQEGGYALGYFEAWDSYSLEAVIEAAETENAPVILGFGCMMVSEPWLDAGGIECSEISVLLWQSEHTCQLLFCSTKPIPINSAWRHAGWL